MKKYTLYADENGNPIITQGDETISIKIPRQEGVEISEEEANDLSPS